MLNGELRVLSDSVLPEGPEGLQCVETLGWDSSSPRDAPGTCMELGWKTLYGSLQLISRFTLVFCTLPGFGLGYA